MLPGLVHQRGQGVGEGGLPIISHQLKASSTLYTNRVICLNSVNQLVSTQEIPERSRHGEIHSSSYHGLGDKLCFPCCGWLSYAGYE